MQAKKIAVVGAGPAGMMAAIRLGWLTQDVTLIEKNHTLGKKLLLSGKGRCNLTNTCELEEFLKRFSGNGQFLRDAFKKFFHPELINFFQERGLGLKQERQGRIFPETDSSASILEVLKKELQRNRVKIIFADPLQDISVENKKIKGLILKERGFIPFDKVILASGGLSYAFTGSSGEVFRMLERLGHNINPLMPGLVALQTRQRYALEGLTLKNIRIKFNSSGKQIVSQIGELLFTDFGISGPLVLSLSGEVARWLRDDKKVSAEIDLKPALSKEMLNSRLLREFRLNNKKALKNILKSLLPLRLIDVFIEISAINPDIKANQVTCIQRGKIIELFKKFSLEISQTRPLDEAMVTVGGVSLKEINPRSMESRLISGLYFAGEMIDLAADTGGFNLQAAFSTGYLAAESAALS
jgi:predicted Rossmann fold flavoprotein